MEDIFEKLEKIIEMRQNERPENSYVAELWKKGDDFILKKIGEESAELIIASKNKNEDEIKKHILYIKDEIPVSNKAQRMIELKNWIDNINYN